MPTGGARTPTPESRHPSSIDVWLGIVVPVVAFWLLLLFAPASSRLALGERIGGGVLFAAFFVPLMWFRMRNGA
jgi:hypothetical protein